MNHILKQIQAFPDWQNKYNQFAVKNNINSVNFNLVKQENFENFQNFIQAIVQKGPRKSKKRWVSNERRILYVLLNCISVMRNILVEQFNTEQIQRIMRVFPYKNKYSIEYQIKKLTTNSKQNRRRWSQKQELVLQQIVEKTQNKNKWNEIARQLFIFSKGEHFRQGKHCRQRYFKLLQQKGQENMCSQFPLLVKNKRTKQSQFHSYNSSYSSQPDKRSCSISQNCRKSNSKNSKNSNIEKLEQMSYNYKDQKEKVQCQKGINQYEVKQQTLESLSNKKVQFLPRNNQATFFDGSNFFNSDIKSNIVYLNQNQQNLNPQESKQKNQYFYMNNFQVVPQNGPQKLNPYYIIHPSTVNMQTISNPTINTQDYQSWLAYINFCSLYGVQLNYQQFN